MTHVHSCLCFVATDTRLFICEVWVCRNSLPCVAAARNVSMMWSSLSFVLAIDVPSPAPARIPAASSRALSHTSRHWPCVTWPRHISWHIVTCVARLPPCQPVCRTIGEWNIFSSEWNIFQQIAGTEGNHRSDCQGEVNNLSALGLWFNFGHRTQGWGEEWSRRIILTSSLPQYGWCYKYGIIASCSRYKIYDVLSDGNHHKKYCTHTGGQQPGPGPGQETNGVLLKRGLVSWGWPVLAS